MFQNWLAKNPYYVVSYSALAQSNTSDVTQSGMGYDATVSQPGSSNDSDIDQSGDGGGSATVTQNGMNNYSNVAQSNDGSGLGGDGAVAVISQDSTTDNPNSVDPTNDSNVIQSGASRADVTQRGEGNASDVNQSGALSTANHRFAARLPAMTPRLPHDAEDGLAASVLAHFARF